VGRRPARKEKKIHFSILFSTQQPQTPILSKINSFSGFRAKIKVVPKFLLYNFAKRSKVKIQIDFELEN
jgi:hypothetical protein